MNNPKFERAELILGKENLNKLKDAKIVIFGMGAVGYHCTEMLARSGAENFKIIDFDKVSISNTNRHLLALDGNYDKLKVEVAKDRLQKINSNINIEAISSFGHNETFEEIIDKDTTLVIDAIDSLNPKVSLIEYCIKNGFNIVSSMGAARRTDPTKISFSDISKVHTCPLGKMVKKRLRKRDIHKGVDVVFSYEQKNSEHIKKEKEENFYNRGRLRVPNGSLAMITSIFGSYLALLALEKIKSSNSIIV